MAAQLREARGPRERDKKVYLFNAGAREKVSVQCSLRTRKGDFCGGWIGTSVNLGTHTQNGGKLFTSAG